MRANVVAAVPRCALCLAAASAFACNIDNPGDPPPPGTLYFPTALGISGDADGDGAPDRLFVANSNFDLRFSSGSVLAFDLAGIGDAIEDCEQCVEQAEAAESECRAACAAGDCTMPPDAGLTPEEACDACYETCDAARRADDEACAYDDGKCFLDPADDALLVGEQRVGSFVTGVLPSRDGDLLFVVSRDEDDLTVVPVDRTGSADVLDCGTRGVCDRRSTPADNDLPSWPGDPVGLITGPLSDWTDAPVGGDYVMVAHRGGAVSLFVERGSDRRFVWTDTIENFPTLASSGIQLTGIARDPTTGLAHLTMIRLAQSVVSSGKLLGRVGVVVPEDPERASLYDAGLLSLEGVDVATDTRAITFVPAVPGSSAAVAGPRALVVARLPWSLLTVDVDPSRNELGRARVLRISEIGTGAARAVAGTLGGAPVAIVSCFDSREVFIVDLQSGETRSIVRNLSGPFEIALDEARERLYVADFRTSVVRVLDLSAVGEPDASGETSARLVATLGAPRVVQELQ